MKIICAPQKVGTSTQNGRSIKRLHPRIVGMTEMDNGINDGLLTAMSHVLGRAYKLFARDKGQHSREIPLYVRIGIMLKVVSYDTISLSPNVGSTGMGNDRWANVMVVKWFGKTWCIIMTHLNAGIQAVNTTDARLLQNAGAKQRQKAYVMSVTRLERLIVDAMSEHNMRVVVMGDFNMLPKGDGLTWEFSPRQMFKRLNMRWVNDRVIYMAWGRGVNMYRHTIIPAHSPGNASDHAWIVGWFWRSR